MNTLVEIQKERETKLKSARLEAGFYNVIGGQRAVAASQLSVINLFALRLAKLANSTVLRIYN